MTEEQAEKILLEYKELEYLVELLESSADRKPLAVALSLGPSSKTTHDITRPSVQEATPQEWAVTYERLNDMLSRQEQAAREEYQRYLAKLAAIKKAIADAELEKRERIYVELRYIKGLPINEIGNYKNMRLSRTALKEIRKNALKKIAGVM